MKTKHFLAIFSLLAVVLILAFLGGTWQTTLASGTIPTRRPPTHTPMPKKTVTVTRTHPPKPEKTVTQTKPAHKPTKTPMPRPKPPKSPHCFQFLWWWVCLWW